jgi:hypothetical protein
MPDIPYVEELFINYGLVNSNSYEPSKAKIYSNEYNFELILRSILLEKE